MSVARNRLPVVLLWMFAFCCQMLWAPGAGAQDALSLGSTDTRIQEIVLPSGQTLYIQEDHSQPIVTIDSWVMTGSVNETDETNGISHFLEHLLFKGTDRYRVGELDRLIESKGGTFNAATSDDFTHYYITIASPFFEEALALHANMLLKAVVPEPELDRERKVVQEEINRSLDQPERRVFIEIAKLLFKGHSYAYDTLGTKELIAGVPRERILNYYHYWYQPQNIKTVIVGDVDAARTVERVKALFPASSFPPVTEGPNAYVPPKVVMAKQPGGFGPIKLKVIEDPNVSHCYLGLAFLGPSIEDRRETFALDTAMLALGSGQSSRLYRRLKEETRLVNAVGAGNWTQKYAGQVYVSAEIAPENLEKAEAELLKTLIAIRQEGITAEELEKAKTQTIKQHVFLNESTEGVASTLGYNVTIGKLSDYTDYVANIQKVTRRDVREALARYLDFYHAVLVEVVPPGQGAGASATYDRLFNLLVSAASGELAEETAAKTSESAQSHGQPSPTIHREMLPNGMTLILKPRKDSETVALQIFIRGGQAVEAVPGLSMITARLLKKGTLARSNASLTRELESRGMNLDIASQEDYFQVSATAIAEDLGELFLVLSDVLTRPAFDPDEIDKEREHLRRTLQASRDEPATIALENLSLALYPEHPYGNIGKRVEAHLDLIDRDRLTDAFNTYFVPANMIVSAVGNFDPETLRNYLLMAFPEALNRRSPVAGKPLEIEPVPAIQKPRVIEEGKAQQAATWIAQGWLAPAVASNDFVPLKVVNSLLGTGMSSRLFVNLREKQGLAYVVSSTFPSLRDKSRFVLYIGTDPQNRDRVISGFRKEIDRLKETPVTVQELQEAKDKLSGAFALAHETNANQAFYLGFYEVMGLGYGFDERYPALIQQVTAEDIRQAANRYFSQPAVLSVVAPTAGTRAEPRPESPSSPHRKKSQHVSQ